MIFLPLGAEQKPKRTPYLTLAIIGLNLLVYLYLNSLDHEELHATILFFGYCPVNPFFFHIITSQFMQVDWDHLLGNMIFLWTFGAYLETVVSQKRFLFYYLGAGVAGSLVSSLLDLIFLPEIIGRPAIGASGAISGLMGAWIVRCYYNKVKLGVSLFDIFGWLPKRLKISPWILIGYYFGRDIYGGLCNLDNPNCYIGYWDHVGGLLFGVAMTWHLREHWQAQLDHCRVRARYWLGQGIGFNQVRQDLQKVITRDPKDAWALLDLARVESRDARGRKGQELYRRAVLAFWKLNEKGQAAYVFAEYFQKYLEVSFGLMPFAICRELIKVGEDEVAARALEQFIKERTASSTGLNHPQLEAAYVMLGNLFANRLHAPVAAERCLAEYLQRFPAGRLRETADQILELLRKAQAA